MNLNQSSLALASITKILFAGGRGREKGGCCRGDELCLCPQCGVGFSHPAV